MLKLEIDIVIIANNTDAGEYQMQIREYLKRNQLGSLQLTPNPKIIL